MYKVGEKIRIIKMEGEPQYTNAVGVITRIGQDPYNKETMYYGTWGGCAVYADTDLIERVSTLIPEGEEI